ncbi:MAG: DUF1566 domain-containing protein [Polyangiaceae bacterium]|nr:DUF1566 domain-containing protein [Polyangiaceae bacterium]
MFRAASAGVLLTLAGLGAGGCLFDDDYGDLSGSGCGSEGLRCDGATLFECVDGSYRVRAVCTGETPLCVAGACAECAGGPEELATGRCGSNGYAAGPLPGPERPASYLEDGPDGVFNEVTGLYWERQAAPGTYTWAEARRYCDDLNKTWLGWRLPTRMELISLVDYSRRDPAIDTTIFPMELGPHEVDPTFWSSSVRVEGQGWWYVNFRDGLVNLAGADQRLQVRCVLPLIYKRLPPRGNFFEVTGNTVVDTATGLEWQRETSATKQTREAALSTCAGLSVDGKTGWRLPTVAELSSLVPGSKITAPAINEEIFPGTQPEGYWSATLLAGSEDPWYVSFTNYNPMTDHWDQAEERWVRCVRLTPEATR